MPMKFTPLTSSNDNALHRNNRSPEDLLYNISHLLELDDSDVAEDRLTADETWELIYTLTPTQRKALVLYMVHRWSLREVAAVMNCTPQNVSLRVRAALYILKQRLAEMSAEDD